MLAAGGAAAPAPACSRWITSGEMSSDRSADTSTPPVAEASKIME